MTFDFPENDLQHVGSTSPAGDRDRQSDGRVQVAGNPRKAPYTITQYQSTHNTGGTVMGTDPSTSVVNRYLQSWDAPNVFVIGASELSAKRFIQSYRHRRRARLLGRGCHCETLSQVAWVTCVKPHTLFVALLAAASTGSTHAQAPDGVQSPLADAGAAIASQGRERSGAVRELPRSAPAKATPPGVSAARRSVRTLYSRVNSTFTRTEHARTRSWSRLPRRCRNSSEPRWQASPRSMHRVPPAPQGATANTAAQTRGRVLADVGDRK